MTVFVHPSAIIDQGAHIGEGAYVWHFCHVMGGARIGPGASLGQGCFVAASASIGARSRIQNNVSIFDGVTIEEDVFVGPSVVFTNVRRPRAHINQRSQFEATHVARGATVGAGAVIVCGHDIGEYAFVAAGAVITHDVPAFALMMGNPARRVGWVSRRGLRLAGGRCPETGESYVIEGETCRLASSLPSPEVTSARARATSSREGHEAIRIADLEALHAPLRDDLRAAFERVLASGELVLGREVEAFEASMAAHLALPHVIGVSSGTDALLVALMALGVGPGDEVITTPFSFFATVGAIVRVGATPVFADVDAHALLDAQAVSSVLTPRTRAILPVHLFGRACDPGLFALARAHGIAVVEDAAHALGVRTDLGALGGLGALGCFSFFPTKNLGALGDAGMVTTRDDKLAERVRLLRSHGAQPKYHHLLCGGNFRMDALQAALLSTKLPHLAAWTAARRRNARVYDRLFRGEPRLESAIDEGRLNLPELAPSHAFHHYVIRCERRDALQSHLASASIETAVYYPEPLHLQPALAHLGYREGSMPRAEQASSQVLALPVHPSLTSGQIERIVERVWQFFE